ncbi:DNA mismatch repair protein [Oleoguttula sp. CCFEE 5521]
MSTHGTEVVVKDIFGNMPVRLKQRALSHDVGRTHDLKIRASIKHSLVALLVAWKRPCIIKLHGAEEASMLTEKSLNRLDGIGARFDMRDALSIVFQAGLAEHSTRTKWVPVSASTLRITVRGMICTEPAASKTCQFVSMGPRPCNAAGAESELYECINKIFENSSFGIVEDEQVIPDEAELLRRRRDRRFKMDGHTLKSTRGTKGVDRWPMFVLQIRRSEADPGSLQSTASSERELRPILDVLDAMVRQWLTAQGCRSRKKRRRADDPRKNHSVQQQGIRDRSLLNVDTRDDVWPESDTSMSVRPSTADTLSRIKAGRRSLLDVWESRKPRTAPEGQIGSTTKYARHADGLVSRRLASLQVRRSASRRPRSDTAVQKLLVKDDTLSSDQFGGINDSDMIEAFAHADSDCPSMTNENGQTCDDQTTAWTDPRSGQAFTINTRTGIVLPTCIAHVAPQHHVSGSVRARQSAAINTATTSAGRPLTLARRGDPTRSVVHSQGSHLLDWKNPVFAKPNECQIPVTLVRLPGDDTGGIHYAHCYHDVQTAFAPEADGASTITKSALRSAIVVRQVDRKYILASLTCRHDTTLDATKALVIIDQHAASERVMLEALLADLCTPADPEVSALPSHSASACRPGVACTALAPPIVFELSTRELELFTLHEQHFARWGIIFDLHHQMEILGTSQVRQAQVQPTLRVLALPPVIIERCKLFPKLLVELLRGEIWTLADRFQWPRSARAEDPADESTVANGENHQWLRKIGSCPKGLIDLLNSRACRSAIMFNDVLSVPECQELLDKLGRCAFPFMCAHGRVSMAPLVDTKDVAALMAGSGIGQSALPRTAAAKAESPFVQTYTQWTRLSLNNENG